MRQPIIHVVRDLAWDVYRLCFITALRSSRREPSFGCDMRTDFEEADDDMKEFALQYANNIIQQSLNQVCQPAVGSFMCRTALPCFKLVLSKHQTKAEVVLLLQLIVRNLLLI